MENTISDKSRLWTLFKTCFIISACTFGGGMVIISMLQKKFVEELHWISQDEVMDLVAIAQSCPGVMAVNTSIIIGYHIAGVAGALLTVTGTILPPMIILTIVSMFYVQFRSNPVIALLLLNNAGRSCSRYDQHDHHHGRKRTERQRSFLSSYADRRLRRSHLLRC